MSKQVTFEAVRDIMNEFSNQHGLFNATKMLKNKDIKGGYYLFKAMSNLGLINPIKGKGSKWIGPRKPDPILARHILSEFKVVRKLDLKRVKYRYAADKQELLELKGQQSNNSDAYVVNYTEKKPNTKEMIDQLKKAGYTIQRTEEFERGFNILGIKVTWTKRKAITL